MLTDGYNKSSGEDYAVSEANGIIRAFEHTPLIIYKGL